MMKEHERKQKEGADIILREMQRAAILELEGLHEVLEKVGPDLIRMSREETRQDHDDIAMRMLQALSVLIKKQLTDVKNVDTDELSIAAVKSGAWKKK